MVKLLVFWSRVQQIGRNIGVALSMLACAVLLAPWSKPRETVSGFIGRKALLGSNVALWLAECIDFLVRERAHCGDMAIAEDNMRQELYPGMGVN